MRKAKEWADEFLNNHVLNVRGQEFEAFVQAVQKDAYKAGSQFERDALLKDFQLGKPEEP